MSSPQYTVYVLKCRNNTYYVGRTTDLHTRLQQHFNGVGCQFTKLNAPINVVETKLGCGPFDENNMTIQYMIKYGIQSVRGGPYSKIELDNTHINSIIDQIRGAEDRCHRCNLIGHMISHCRARNWCCLLCLYTSNTINCEQCQQCGYVCNDTSISVVLNNAPQPNKHIVCYRCGITGHYATTCYVNIDNSSHNTSVECDTDDEDISSESDSSCDVGDSVAYNECRRCGRAGHWARNCFARTDVDGYYINCN